VFTAAPALVANLARAHAEGRLEERLGFYAKPKLLIVDELGYLPFEPDAAHLFFQLVSRCYERGSDPRRQLPAVREAALRPDQGRAAERGSAGMTGNDRRPPTATRAVHFSVSPPAHFRMSFDTHGGIGGLMSLPVGCRR
jgi:IstB-like ATP binding protein